MDSFWSVIIGAVVALGGGAITTLLAPWIARRWTRSDRAEDGVREHAAALRAAVEDFLSSVWESDIELSITAMAEDPEQVIEDDDARARLRVQQRTQRAEVHLALLLSEQDQPIHDMALAYTQAVFERPGRGQANEVGLAPIRQEVITRFARWMSHDETAQEAKVAFDAWLQANWLPGRFRQIDPTEKKQGPTDRKK